MPFCARSGNDASISLWSRPALKSCMCQVDRLQDGSGSHMAALAHNVAMLKGRECLRGRCWSRCACHDITPCIRHASTSGVASVTLLVSRDGRWGGTWQPLRAMLRCSKVRVPPGTRLATAGLPLLPGAICHSASMSAAFIGRSFTMMSTSTCAH